METSSTGEPSKDSDRPAEISALNLKLGSHWISASKPSQPSTASGPAAACSCALAPIWNVWLVMAR